jgi:outer membrane protein assembly factor BamA
MRRAVLLLQISLLGLCACWPATAQKFQPKAIQFNGDPEYTDQELMAAAGLKAGTVLTSAEMNDHSKLLMDSGVFDGLTFKFDGVNLVFSLTPAALMYPIRLENLPLTLTGKDLDAKLHERLPLYHGKVPPEGTLLDNVRAALVEMLAAQGINATVTATPAGNQETKKVDTMAFSISAPEVHPSIAHVDGVTPAFENQVDKVIANLGSAPFDTAATASNLERVLDTVYQDRGYAAAKVDVSRSGAASTTAAGIQVPFEVKIDQGKLYKLGSIHLPADALATQADIDKVTAAQTAAGRAPSVRAVWSMISARYKAKGYVDFAMTPHPSFDDATGTVNYAVDLNPGPVYHLGLLKFDNVSDDLRKLLMRNWQMFPGDPFDQSYLTAFIQNTQVADPVLQRTLNGVKVTYDVRADPASHDVNIVIRLERR